jgi:dUTP pyrophosphatase
MQKQILKVKKLPHFRGDLPRYETLHASGMDIRAALEQALTILPGARLLIPTGIAMEIPVGFEIQVRPRSGWATKFGITVVNSPGTIDADYRGELKVGLINLGAEAVMIQDQERIAQIVLAPVVQAQWEIVTELSSSERGEAGFGSTGKI